jgi:hypothetical protein
MAATELTVPSNPLHAGSFNVQPEYARSAYSTHLALWPRARLCYRWLQFRFVTLLSLADVDSDCDR